MYVGFVPTHVAAPPAVLPMSQRPILEHLQVMRQQPLALLRLTQRLSATSRTQQSRLVVRHRASL